MPHILSRNYGARTKSRRKSNMLSNAKTSMQKSTSTTISPDVLHNRGQCHDQDNYSSGAVGQYSVSLPILIRAAGDEQQQQEGNQEIKARHAVTAFLPQTPLILLQDCHDIDMSSCSLSPPPYYCFREKLLDTPGSITPNESKYGRNTAPLPNVVIPSTARSMSPLILPPSLFEASSYTDYYADCSKEQQSTTIKMQQQHPSPTSVAAVLCEPFSLTNNCQELLLYNSRCSSTCEEQKKKDGNKPCYFIFDGEAPRSNLYCVLMQYDAKNYSWSSFGTWTPDQDGGRSWVKHSKSA